MAVETSSTQLTIPGESKKLDTKEDGKNLQFLNIIIHFDSQCTYVEAYLSLCIISVSFI